MRRCCFVTRSLGAHQATPGHCMLSQSCFPFLLRGHLTWNRVSFFAFGFLHSALRTNSWCYKTSFSPTRRSQCQRKTRRGASLSKLLPWKSQSWKGQQPQVSEGRSQAASQRDLLPRLPKRRVPCHLSSCRARAPGPRMSWSCRFPRQSQSISRQEPSSTTRLMDKGVDQELPKVTTQRALLRPILPRT